MNWINIISSLIGTIVGGAITWISTSKALKEQFDNELKMKKINQKQKILNSLNGIKLEIGYNVQNAKKLIGISNKNEIDIKNINLVTFFKKNKWEELNHNLNFESSESLVVDLQIFYIKISDVINTNYITKEKNNEILKEGAQCMENLNNETKLIKCDIDKIKKSSQKRQCENLISRMKKKVRPFIDKIKNLFK
jgi:hypothetical protein